MGRLSEADALREELARVRRRLAAAEAKEAPVAVALARPVLAEPVVGPSAAPFATATRVQTIVRGHQARHDPARAIVRAHSIGDPAIAVARASLRPLAREMSYDAEAARPAEEAVDEKEQRMRYCWAMGWTLLVGLLQLFALLDHRHWAEATFEAPQDRFEVTYDLYGWSATGYVNVVNGTRRLRDANCPADMYDATGGDSNWWSCGNGCAGGTYTDDACACACQCTSGSPADLRESAGPCLEEATDDAGDPPPTDDLGDPPRTSYRAEGRGCAPCAHVSKGECPATDFGGQDDCTHQSAALIGASICLATALIVFVFLCYPGGVCPGRFWTLRNQLVACGWALGCGGAVAAGTTAEYARENGRRFSADDVACGRGCADALGGGVVAVLCGLAMAKSQNEKQKLLADCWLAAGCLAVVAFLLLTAVAALWNFVVGFVAG